MPLAIMWFFFPVMREFWWLTAIFAALIGASVSFLFLRKPLANASSEIYQRREARVATGKQTAEERDAAAEDAAFDDAPSNDSQSADNNSTDS
ncbi:DUF4229 domain-containing protein [Microbacterium sp. CH12i]|uniref:DUF4229 domain-containing protein n=1 Tax=Microbacterium sp. CH12i TaxID=1479651 RepID=UPI001F3B9C2E